MAAPRYSWEQPEPVAPTAPDPVLLALDALTSALLSRPEPDPSPAPVVSLPAVQVAAPDLDGLAAMVGSAVEAAMGRALAGLPGPSPAPDFTEVTDAIRQMSKRALQAAASAGGGSTGGPFPLILSANGPGTTAQPLAVTSTTTGTYTPYAGTAATVDIPSGAKITSVAASATSAATFTFLGVTFQVPANNQVQLAPINVVGPQTLVFTGTSGYVVETTQ